MFGKENFNKKLTEIILDCCFAMQLCEISKKIVNNHDEASIVEAMGHLFYDMTEYLEARDISFGSVESVAMAIYKEAEKQREAE